MYQKAQLCAIVALNLKSSILMTNLQEKDMNIYWEAKLESEQF